MTRINNCACFFLVSLRLVIGWHFLVEGYHKIHSHEIGKTSRNVPWTGAGFFKEGHGPAAPIARAVLELDDAAQLNRLTVRDGAWSPGQAAEWDTFLERFVGHFGLSPDQKATAAAVVERHKKEALEWLAGNTPTTVAKDFAWGKVDLQLTVPARIAEARQKLKQVEETYDKLLPAFNRDVEKARLRSLKADASKAVADLVSEYESRLDAMKNELGGLLTAEQKKAGPLADAEPRTRIAWLDKITMWTHVVFGGMLLIGVLTRVSSLALAGFLLSVILIAPAVPFAPTPPGAIGHYLYVNLYTIEFVALLALACMPTGKWFGLDAAISAFRDSGPKVYTPGPVTRGFGR
jgi:uncharacterized membrane protein YphA (DoxX/SURF4 family)